MWWVSDHCSAHMQWWPFFFSYENIQMNSQSISNFSIHNTLWQRVRHFKRVLTEVLSFYLIQNYLVLFTFKLFVFVREWSVVPYSTFQCNSWFYGTISVLLHVFSGWRGEAFLLTLFIENITWFWSSFFFFFFCICLSSTISFSLEDDWNYTCYSKY